MDSGPAMAVNCEAGYAYVVDKVVADEVRERDGEAERPSCRRG
jgi:hypothetical protein